MATEIYMVTDTQTIRRPGISDLVRGGYRYVTKWIARGTGTVLYKSSPKFDRAETENLARRWLLKQDPGRYVELNTTKG